MEVLKKYIPIILFVGSFIWMLRVLLLPGYPDFQVHYYGAQHLIQRENPYQADTDYFTPQVYPPFDMVFFIPLTLFTFDVASKLWIILSIVAIFFSILLVNNIYKVSFFHPINLFLSALVMASFPLKFTLGMGQINVIILLFTVFVWFYINKKDEHKAGIFLAFPVMLKFFPLLLLPYLVILRKWKILIVFATTLIGLFLLSLLFVSFNTHIYFFQTLLPDLLASWKGDYYNQSFTGLLMRNIGDETLRQVLRAVIPILFLIVSFAIIILKRKKSQMRINLEIALLITVSLLINNFSWQHHFILLLLPFFILVYTVKEIKGKPIVYFGLACSYALIALNLKDPLIVPNILQSHVFFGGLLLWSSNLYLLIKLRK